MTNLKLEQYDARQINLRESKTLWNQANRNSRFDQYDDS